MILGREPAWNVGGCSVGSSRVPVLGEQGAMDPGGQPSYTQEDLHQAYSLELLRQAMSNADILGRASSVDPSRFAGTNLSPDLFSHSPEALRRGLLPTGSLDLDDYLSRHHSWDHRNGQGLVGPTGSLPNFGPVALRTLLPNMSNANANRPVCRFWPQGRCTYGSNCRFVHPVNMRGQMTAPSSSGSQCRYFPHGRCHYGNQCRFKHEETPGRPGPGPMQGGPQNGSNPMHGSSQGGPTGPRPIARNGSAALLQQSLTEELMTASSLGRRLSLAPSGSMPSPSSLLGSGHDLLGSAYGSQRANDALDNELEMARRSGFLQFSGSGHGQDLFGNGTANGGDNLNEFRFNGQLPMMSKTSGNLSQLSHAMSGGLAGMTSEGLGRTF